MVLACLPHTSTRLGLPAFLFSLTPTLMILSQGSSLRPSLLGLGAVHIVIRLDSLVRGMGWPVRWVRLPRGSILVHCGPTAHVLLSSLCSSTQSVCWVKGCPRPTGQPPPSTEAKASFLSTWASSHVSTAPYQKPMLTSKGQVYTTHQTWDRVK